MDTKADLINYLKKLDLLWDNGKMTPEDARAVIENMSQTGDLEDLPDHLKAKLRAEGPKGLTDVLGNGVDA